MLLVKECLERAGLWREARNRLNERAGGALSGGWDSSSVCALPGRWAARPQGAAELPDEPCSALRSHLDRRDRRDHQRAVGRGDHRDRHPQHATGPAGVRQLRAVPAGRWVAIFSGHIVETGPTKQIFTDPVDPRTSDYVQGKFG